MSTENQIKIEVCGLSNCRACCPQQWPGSARESTLNAARWWRRTFDLMREQYPEAAVCDQEATVRELLRMECFRATVAAISAQDYNAVYDLQADIREAVEEIG